MSAGGWSTNGRGWPIAGSGGSPFTTDYPVGALRASGDFTAAQDPSWTTNAINSAVLFSNPIIISNAGSGAMQVSQAGIYLAFGYVTSSNQASAAFTQCRFSVNGAEASQSRHRIYEDGDNNDQDMLSKGVPLLLAANDIVKFEINSNKTNTIIKETVSWCLVLLSGTQGPAGPAGPAGFSTDEISVYHTGNGTNQDFSTPRNSFQNDAGIIHVSEFYDVSNCFDVITGRWTPTVGKHQIDACFNYLAVNTSARCRIRLYNITQAAVVLNGSMSRTTDTGAYRCTLSGQISANGTDVFELQTESTDSAIDNQEGPENQYFQTHRFTVTP